MSASVFPQLSFPTGSRREGIREGAFLWRYHERAGPNEFEPGIAAFYDLTPQWTLLGEQRVTLPTAGQGMAEWLFNLGAFYELTDQFAVFGSAGMTFRASSRVEERTFMFLVGVEITYGSENGGPGAR